MIDRCSAVFEVKELAEDGTFRGIASVYGVEDLGGDVIDKGALAKSLQENGTVPLLWQHQTAEVIGEVTVREWQNKVLVDGHIDLDDETGKKAYNKLKKKLVKGLSIGFTTIKTTWEEIEGRMIRHVQELKLWEVSLVTFPMLPQAQVTRVKSAEDEALRVRLDRLEQKVSTALPDTEVPTPHSAEPGQPAEPPNPAAEPVRDHSTASYIVSKMMGDLKHGA